MKRVGFLSAALSAALLLPHASSAAVTRVFPHIGPVSVTHIEHLAVVRTQQAELEQRRGGVHVDVPKRPTRYRARLKASRRSSMLIKNRTEPTVDVDVVHRDANPISGIEMTRQYTLTYSQRTGQLLGMKVRRATAAEATQFGLPFDPPKHNAGTQSTKRVKP
jgi:hypothetical protein